MTNDLGSKIHTYGLIKTDEINNIVCQHLSTQIEEKIYHKVKWDGYLIECHIELAMRNCIFRLVDPD
jgi:hypothetical protein